MVCIKLKVEANSTVGQLVMIIENEVEPTIAHLISGGKVLSSTSTLQELNIVEGTKVYAMTNDMHNEHPALIDKLAPCLQGKECVFVWTLTGKLITLEYNANKTVEQLKQDIQEKEGIPLDQQHLIFDDNQLQDERTLLDYDIYSECVLFLRLLGD